MSHQTEDWPKPRGRGDFFTDDEKTAIREYFEQGKPARYVARFLQCSTRAINAHYARFNGVESEKRKKARAAMLADRQSQPRPPVDRASRFYRSNFEPM